MPMSLGGDTGNTIPEWQRNQPMQGFCLEWAGRWHLSLQNQHTRQRINKPAELYQPPSCPCPTSNPLHSPSDSEAQGTWGSMSDRSWGSSVGRLEHCFCT